MAGDVLTTISTDNVRTFPSPHKKILYPHSSPPPLPSSPISWGPLTHFLVISAGGAFSWHHSCPLLSLATNTEASSLRHYNQVCAVSQPPRTGRRFPGGHGSSQGTGLLSLMDTVLITALSTWLPPGFYTDSRGQADQREATGRHSPFPALCVLGEPSTCAVDTPLPWFCV